MGSLSVPQGIKVFLFVGENAVDECFDEDEKDREYRHYKDEVDGIGDEPRQYSRISSLSFLCEAQRPVRVGWSRHRRVLRVQRTMKGGISSPGQGRKLPRLLPTARAPPQPLVGQVGLENLRPRPVEGDAKNSRRVPRHDRGDVRALKHAVEIDAEQVPVEVDAIEEGVDVDPREERIEIDAG